MLLTPVVLVEMLPYLFSPMYSMYFILLMVGWNTCHLNTNRKIEDPRRWGWGISEHEPGWPSPASHCSGLSALSEEAWLPAHPLISHRRAALELSRGLGSQARKLFGPEEMGSIGVCPDHSGSAPLWSPHGNMWQMALRTVHTWALHWEVALWTRTKLPSAHWPKQWWGGQYRASKWWLRKGTTCCPVFWL